MKQLLSKELVETIGRHTVSLVESALARGVTPQLAVVLVGDNPESVHYVDLKSRKAKEKGIMYSLYHMEDESAFETIEEAVRFLDADPEVHGIIIQLPLPTRFSAEQTDKLLQTISPEKDVDGLRGDWKKLTYSSYALPALLEPSPYPLPPMVSSVMGLLDAYDIDVHAKNIIVVGDDRLAGEPLYVYLKLLGEQVALVTEETENIFSITRQADVLISCTGQDDLITHEWIKEGAVVIDCAADVHVDSVGQIASALAPSRGGVGPLTVAWLLHNIANQSNQPSHA